VDGRPTDVRPAGGFSLAVRVDAGRHDVVLRCEEPRLLPGAMIAAATAFVLLASSAARKRAAQPRTRSTARKRALPLIM